MAAIKEKDDFPTFKGRPLVRSGNTLYYGHPDDPFVALLQVTGSEDFQDMEIGNKVTVQILSTDPNVSTRNRIWRRTEKNGLYNALTIATIWLSRASNNK